MSEEQLDWVGMEDRLVARRRLLTESVYRLGLGEVAHKLGEAPSTIKHQIDRDANKRPSSDLSDLCEELDPEYRRAKAALMHEELVTHPDMTPEEAMREMSVRAQMKGYLDKAEIAQLFARVRRAQ